MDHAWADISHAYAYKSDFPIPALWQRETFRAAALLENAVALFAHMQEGLEQYRVSYGAYMTRTQMKEKLRRLNIVISAGGVTESERADLALTIGRMSVELERTTGNQPLNVSRRKIQITTRTCCTNAVF